MSASPLSRGIPLPADMLDALGEYRKAIAETKKELRELEKEARRVAEETGATDPGLQSRIVGLQAFKGSLEQKMENMAAHKAAASSARAAELAAEEANALASARIAFVRGGVLKAFGASDTVGGAMAGAVYSAGIGQRMAGAVERLGFTEAAGALRTGSAAVGAATRFLSGPAAIPLAVMSAAGKVWRDTNEAVRRDGEAMQAQASRVLSVVGGPISGISAEDAYSARIGFRRLESAQAIGRARAAIGLGGALVSALGYMPDEAIQYGEELAEHEKRLIEARKAYGQAYNPYANRQVKKAADLAHARKTEFTQDFWSASAYYAKGAYYSLTGSGMDYMRQEYSKELMAAAEKDIETEKKRRESELFQWNVGVRGAVNRVLEHEQRRHLAVVEQDRIARWASWGMQ